MSKQLNADKVYDESVLKTVILCDEDEVAINQSPTMNDVVHLSIAYDDNNDNYHHMLSYNNHDNDNIKHNIAWGEESKLYVVPDNNNTTTNIAADDDGDDDDDNISPEPDAYTLLTDDVHVNDTILPVMTQDDFKLGMDIIIGSGSMREIKVLLGFNDDDDNNNNYNNNNNSCLRIDKGLDDYHSIGTSIIGRMKKKKKKMNKNKKNTSISTTSSSSSSSSSSLVSKTNAIIVDDYNNNITQDMLRVPTAVTIETSEEAKSATKTTAATTLKVKVDDIRHRKAELLPRLNPRLMINSKDNSAAVDTFADQ
jgi:hypothetical protein